MLDGMSQFVGHGGWGRGRGNFDIPMQLERASRGIFQDMDAQGRRQFVRRDDGADQVQPLLDVWR